MTQAVAIEFKHRQVGTSLRFAGHHVAICANVYRNGIADPATTDITIRANSKAVDAGVVLPDINEGFIGKAPDLSCS